MNSTFHLGLRWRLCFRCLLHTSCDHDSTAEEHDERNRERCLQKIESDNFGVSDNDIRIEV